jgi:predicted hydrocarbon binding protein
MFREERTESRFDWSMLGDIAEGRPNLGPTTEVSVYRLMQFTLRDILIRDFGVEAAARVYFDAGKTSGVQLYKNLITQRESLPAFVADLQNLLKQLRIGIIRFEEIDEENLIFKLTVAEDLDCSGLPACGEQVCTYDEGFIAGLLLAHTGREFAVKELDCWSSGDRVCRFEARPVD